MWETQPTERFLPGQTLWLQEEAKETTRSVLEYSQALILRIAIASSIVECHYLSKIILTPEIILSSLLLHYADF